MNRRPKLVYGSQADCVDAWLRQFTPRAVLDSPKPPDVGRARGWYVATTINFSGIHLYSGAGQENEIARMAVTPRGRWVVMVRKDRYQSQARQYRVGSVQWRAHKKGFPWTLVEQFEDHAQNQAWYAIRIRARYGRWKRAWSKWNKPWKFRRLVEAVEQRAEYERLFGLKRTKEESDVRTARVVQALIGK